MGIVTTHDLMDGYFATLSPERAIRTRGQVDRAELYAYEIKIGKQLVDMSAEELLDMISSFTKQRRASGPGEPLSYSSFVLLVSLYRQVFEYYIEKYDPNMPNPLYSKLVRGRTSAMRSIEKQQKINKEMFQTAIDQIHSANASYDGKGDYLECILQLYYNGLSSGEEIASIQTDMVIPSEHKIILDRGTITVSQRCMDLLQKVNSMRVINSARNRMYSLVSWRGSYFKFIVSNKAMPDFDSSEAIDVSRMINWQLKKAVYKTDYSFLNYQNIYYLGFYDYIVSQCGKDRAEELITSVRRGADIDELQRYMVSYCVFEQNITRLKRKLMIYI